MMYAGRVVLIAIVAASAVALPNHLKAVVVDTDPIPKGTSVSASFGGYSAKAGLGGSDGTGGLFASADSPLGSASAGLGGSVGGNSATGGLGASASTGGLGASAGTGGSGASAGAGGNTAVSSGGHYKPSPGGQKPINHQGPNFFDGIFNIPISVLQAVNTYLNNRGPVVKPVHRRRGHYPQSDVNYKAVIPEQAPPNQPAPAPEAAVSATAESGAHSSVDVGAHPGQRPVILQKRVNYDDIFNIPISALKSVNQLLNGHGKK